MPRNIVTEITTQYIKGFDTNGNEFGVFFVQICDVTKAYYGAVIHLETGEQIHIDICYSRLSTMLYEARSK